MRRRRASERAVKSWGSGGSLADQIWKAVHTPANLELVDGPDPNCRLKPPKMGYYRPHSFSSALDASSLGCVLLCWDACSVTVNRV